MSHLTLDARAILHYLNELGYRNISAEQLKEFLKGMQPQSSINSTSKFEPKFNHQQQHIQEQLQQQLPASPVTANAATAVCTTTKRSPSVKVIKCKKPLCHFKFYLDICDHQLTKRIEEQIKLLGGSLEFFLTSNVTHFITDKTTVFPGGILQKVTTTNYSYSPGTPQRPVTPLTPQTPYSLESQEVISSNGFKTNSNNTNSVNAKKTLRQSRADAILSRARRQSVTSATNTPTLGNQLGTNSLQLATTTPLKSQQASSASVCSTPYILWQAEHALRFFKKVQHELKEYLGHVKRSSTKSGSIEPISLKGGFIKIESIRRNCRPYYQLFRKSNEWPKVEISREDGAFRLSPKREIPKGEENKKVAVLGANMTRKSRSRSSQHQNAVKILKKSTTNSQRNAVACKQQQQQQQQKESSDKQCGVCEICKIEYDTLTIHLKTKDHEYFAKNPQNFIALDTLIHTSADVNNFLEENRKLEIKSEPQEMDVDDVEEDEEIRNNNEDEMIVPTTHNSNNSNKKSISEDSVRVVVQKSVSPTLREKSKRVTKGKHSSEKFQNVPSKSPKVPSPQKNVCIGRSFVNELQSPIAGSGLNKNSKKLLSALSPPIRATLPPSSLYKVVETHTDLNCTPPKGRVGRDGAVAAASPSIIVKFKKVRATELQVLNGEAESFMFPKRRSDSSDLPTDIDRQTTSDRVGNTSSSTHSSFSDVEDTAGNLTRIDDVKSVWGKRAIATVKRNSIKGAIVNSSKKNVDVRKQNFPKAPIQPVEQLKQPTTTRKKSTNNDVATAAAIVAATATITLPEATRKSSRTATAIVTAATTSSRLLQAAVEAAKSKNRHLITEAVTATYSKTKTQKKLVKVEPAIEINDDNDEEKCLTESAKKLTLCQKRSKRKPIVKLEDGMGEQNRSKRIPIEEDEEDEIDFDDFDDATVDNDDIKDEDFVIEAERKAQARLKRLNPVKKCLSTNTREERATKRQNRSLNFIKQEPQSEIQLDESTQKAAKVKVKKSAVTTKSSSKKSQLKSSANKKQSKKIERVFDFTKSERLKKLRYAFERLPMSDLWYRVYMRQDECEERYFEYYGATSYRKLPYELGPIPFETTFVDGNSGVKICCNLCQSSHTDSERDAFNGNSAKSEVYNIEIKDEKYEAKPVSTSDSGASSSNVASDFANITGTTLGSNVTQQTYTHKHKKLHLLQRYRQEQEQQELLQRQKLEEQMKHGMGVKDDTSRIERCVVVAAIDPMREKRAGSTHSNASSCASSAATLNKAKKMRQRHFNKAAYLAHLELPPRKSPREHASTLALVSCIIKQRQDSLSKPNSETDEPPTTPIAVTPTDIKPLLDTKSPLLPIETPAATTLPTSLEADTHPDSSRLQAPTPEEELRFATEISETVKRMRRGRNKYDYSPPFVARKVRRPRSNRGRGAANCVLATTGLLWDRHPEVNNLISQTPQTPQTSSIKNEMVTPGVSKRRRGRQKACFVEMNSLMPSIRKTGSKKGVLEFEADATALETLKSAPNDYVNPKLLEWQIDKYLSSVGRQYDATEQNTPLANCCDLRIPSQDIINQNTPPSTDHFSSDFDLCDLLNQGTARESLGTEALGTDENLLVVDTKQKDYSFFNSTPLHSYYRKRKTLKCNRTGWPKVSKKKSTCRQQKLRQRIYFMKASESKTKSNLDMINDEAIKQEPMDIEDIGAGDNTEDNDDTTQEQTRESVVITPPNSDVQMNSVPSKRKKQNDEQDDDETQMMLNEEDADTVAESVEEEETNKVESDADADVEEVDDDEDAEEEEEDMESRKPIKSLQFKHESAAYAMGDESIEKPMRSLELLSPVEKFRNRLLNNSVNSIHSMAASSTPTIHLMRPLRRTPQLNGSLGSCISPSEKAGDNSDIFTVSSDGLETDLDLSNSHSQLKGVHDDDSRHQNHHHYHESHLNNAAGNITPKRKFDISKYAPTNAATCAAEAATAAVKSLAISQFLKKEVRVTCRRLRAPFRRFRYRR
uniref:DBF4-type domain-containing protein n=1 Tax=Glossina brevipalpis TaxID=37001 RepID=A0A1A9WKI1_9MUSC